MATKDPTTWTPGMTTGYRRECCRRCREAAELRNEREWFSRTMIVCPRCGNKRCPKAVDHTHACTNSNDVGQVGAPGEDAVIPPPIVFERVRQDRLQALEAVARAAAAWCEAIDANDGDAQETRFAVYDAEEATRDALRALEAVR